LFEFKHPKYYTELRKRNKSDQVTSGDDGLKPQCVPGPGHKLQATSSKPQASSVKPQAQKASSRKLQAPSNKRQA
jgi:hypothetical protein